MQTIETNSELELARSFIEHTGEHVFLTGKAGTGKTTFLRGLQESTSKRLVVTAPTGVAALNAGGVTLHSFFQLPFGPIVPGQEQQAAYRFSKEKINIYKSLDILVIDEVSMVRADVLDGIDAVLRRFRNTHLPFGGVQLLLIGDLHQLPPVVKPNEQTLLSQHYNSLYFFDSLAIRQAGFVGIELTKVYRQSQQTFIDLLNAVREERWNGDVLSALNERHVDGLSDSRYSNYITLSTHNHKADRLNRLRLEELDAQPHVFTANVTGEFPESIYPVDATLEIKVGARVMFSRNDANPEKRFYNGKMGVVKEVEPSKVRVVCDEDAQDIWVEPVVWENTRYSINAESKSIEPTVLGSFGQIPLRLAWAITIHKSQGLTFDQVIIDAQDAFASGQTYVALSRCRTLEGLVLSSRLSAPSYEKDASLAAFDQSLVQNAPDQERLNVAKQAFQQRMLYELFNFSELSKSFSRFVYALNRQKNVITNVDSETLTELKDSIDQKIVTVAQKFERQLPSYFKQGMPEENSALTDRLRNAGGYFLQVLESIQAIVNPMDVSLDNTKELKRLLKNWDEVRAALLVKVVLFKVCENEFSVSALLRAQAEAVLASETKSNKPKKAPAFSEADIAHPELFEKLRVWRNELAAEQGKPPFSIMHQRVLVQVVCHLPASTGELLALPGIGPATVEKYGDSIIEQINRYCADHNIDLKSHAESIAQQTSKVNPENAGSDIGIKKGESYKVTLDLFLEVRDIETVSENRGLARSTVENHLAKAIETGELALSDLIQDATKIAAIQDAIQSVDGTALKPIKEKLDESISYGEIRWVQASMSITD